MLSLDEELKRAHDEMRAGFLDHAAEILLALKARLSDPTQNAELSEKDRILGLVKVLNNLGVVQKNQGDLESATESLEAALEFASMLETSMVKVRTGILSNLGLLYSRRRMYAKGKAALDEALSLAEKYPDEVPVPLRIKVHNNRALFFVRFGELDKARDELEQSLEISPEDECEDEKEREAWLTANLAMIHAELGFEEIYDIPRQEELFRQARSMFLRSSELYGAQGYTHHKLDQIINAAELEIRLGALEEARRRLKEARKEAERINSGRLLCEIGQAYVEMAVRTGDRQQVLERVVDLLDCFKNFEPSDLPARLTRLESILRRASHKEALQLVAEFKGLKKGERRIPKTSPD